MRTIAITGASGFVGSALSEYLGALGWRVRPLVRPGGHGRDAIAWDPQHGTIDVEALEGLDGIVHLAGESIAEGRWTAAKKQRIRDSRVRGTSLLADAIGKLKQKPKVWVSSSATGLYGDCGDRQVDESAPPGHDFLSSVAAEWEAAAQPAVSQGVRVAHPRFGIVLGLEGGALAKMLPPFKLGLGGKIGSGTQGMSWIALLDAVRAIVHLLEQDLHGPFNVTAPTPVSNGEFTRALGAALDRPTVFSMPAALARLALGEMADAALLGGVRALPKRLLESGFHFEQPELSGFLTQLLS